MCFLPILPFIPDSNDDQKFPTILALRWSGSRVYVWKICLQQLCIWATLQTKMKMTKFCPVNIVFSAGGGVGVMVERSTASWTLTSLIFLHPFLQSSSPSFLQYLHNIRISSTYHSKQIKSSSSVQQIDPWLPAKTVNWTRRKKYKSAKKQSEL